MPVAPFCQDGYAQFDCGIAEPVSLASLAMGVISGPATAKINPAIATAPSTPLTVASSRRP